jgi:hypothetical protein
MKSQISDNPFLDGVLINPIVNHNLIQILFRTFTSCFCLFLVRSAKFGHPTPDWDVPICYDVDPDHIIPYHAHTSMSELYEKDDHKSM